jgi:hypothetical protein
MGCGKEDDEGMKYMKHGKKKMGCGKEDDEGMKYMKHGKKKMGCGKEDGEDAVKSSMGSMKKMLKGGQKKLDVSGPESKPDGKITHHDFEKLRNLKSKKKHHGENEKVTKEESSWWKSVNSMIGEGDPASKYSTGCESLFKTIDTNNLYQALRSES